MSDLNEYLAQKREALKIKKAAAAANTAPVDLKRANVSVEGRSGIRRIRIRDFQIISDSGPDLAGYNLGPGSPELQLGVLGSCLSHIFLIQAAELEVPLDSVEVEVTGKFDLHRAGKPGFEDVPIYPHAINYEVNVTSSASREQIDALHQAVEENCPILNLLKNPQTISGTLNLHAAA